VDFPNVIQQSLSRRKTSQNLNKRGTKKRSKKPNGLAI